MAILAALPPFWKENGDLLEHKRCKLDFKEKVVLGGLWSWSMACMGRNMAGPRLFRLSRNYE